MTFGKTLVIQPSPGIGDMLWHLPYLRALARVSQRGKISLLTKSRNLTKRWLAPDPMIETIDYYERGGGRAAVELLRPQRFQTVWILHRSFSAALVALFSGIPYRHGFGYGAQRYLLTNQRGLAPSLKKTHTIDQLKALLTQWEIPYDDRDQALFIPSALKEEVSQLFGKYEQSIALGLGGSESFKRWPLESFVHVVFSLNALGYKNVFLCGGPGEENDATFILQQVQSRGGSAHKATHYPLEISLAFMGQCEAYIGNDTSLLNAAACLGTPAIGLFGATVPLTYSPFIEPLIGQGMTGISVEQVISRFQEVLSQKRKYS